LPPIERIPLVSIEPYM